MGNAEKAVALSLLAHALLAAVAAALFELSSPESAGAALDVTAVELSLADGASEPVVPVAPPPSVRDGVNAPAPPSDEPVPPVESVKTPESAPMPGTVEIPLAREPAVEMRYEKPAAEEAAARTAGAEQARIEAPASLQKNISPKYPRGSRQRGEEGVVRLELTIDAFGVVTEVSVAVSSGYGELDEAAVNAVKKAVFNPASRGGKAVKSTVGLSFVFKLK